MGRFSAVWEAGRTLSLVGGVSGPLFRREIGIGLVFGHQGAGKDCIFSQGVSGSLCRREIGIGSGFGRLGAREGLYLYNATLKCVGAAIERHY